MEYSLQGAKGQSREMTGRAFPSAFKLKLLSRLWGPFLGAGIRITKVSPDYREIETRLKLHWYNRNFVGTHYGGSLYSMTDPFYMLMLLANIGDKHFVWDKSASIEFVQPVKTEVRATFTLSEDLIQRVVEQAEDDKPHFVEFAVDVLDVEGSVVAKLNKSLYVRRKPRERSE